MSLTFQFGPSKIVTDGSYRLVEPPLFPTYPSIPHLRWRERPRKRLCLELELPLYILIAQQQAPSTSTPIPQSCEKCGSCSASQDLSFQVLSQLALLSYFVCSFQQPPITSIVDFHSHCDIPRSAPTPIPFSMQSLYTSAHRHQHSTFNSLQPQSFLSLIEHFVLYTRPFLFPRII